MRHFQANGRYFPNKRSLISVGVSVVARLHSGGRTYLSESIANGFLPVVSLHPSFNAAAMQINSLENRAFIGLVLIVTLLAIWVLGGFLMPLFWAVLLAVLFAPIHRWIRRRVSKRRGSVSALLTVLIVIAVVLLPLVGLVSAVTSEAVNVVADVRSGEIDVATVVQGAEELLPRVTAMAQEYGVDMDRVQEELSDTALRASQGVATLALSIGQKAVVILLYTVVMLYILFYFIRDGEKIIEALVRALPFGDPRERRLFSRFAEATRATVRGTILIGVVQGALGGLAFWVLGLPAPVLWGTVMAVFSLIPAVGAFAIWLPAAVILLLIGEWQKALALALMGALVISAVDNFLRPILVGRGTRVPDYIILIATLSAIVVWNMSGLVIGPILAVIFLTVWEIFSEEFGHADADETAGTDPARLADEPLPVVVVDPTAYSRSGLPGARLVDDSDDLDLHIDDVSGAKREAPPAKPEVGNSENVEEGDQQS